MSGIRGDSAGQIPPVLCESWRSDGPVFYLHEPVSASMRSNDVSLQINVTGERTPMKTRKTKGSDSYNVCNALHIRHSLLSEYIHSCRCINHAMAVNKESIACQHTGEREECLRPFGTQPCNNSDSGRLLASRVGCNKHLRTNSVSKRTREHWLPAEEAFADQGITQTSRGSFVWLYNRNVGLSSSTMAWVRSSSRPQNGIVQQQIFAMIIRCKVRVETIPIVCKWSSPS